MTDYKAISKDTRKAFRKIGACSTTYYYTLNKAFGQPYDDSIKAVDPLAGGILRKGHQCGMIWGSVMGAGAEAYRRNEDLNQAIGDAMQTSTYLLDSFKEETQCVNCSDVTGIDFKNNWTLIRFILTNARYCFKLAGRWAPKAIEAARKGLDDKKAFDLKPLSCASETVKMMGGTEEEIVSVAGWAGGIALSGKTCGALSAAIWLNTKKWQEENPGKPLDRNPKAAETYHAFLIATHNKTLCNLVCGRNFNSIEDHSDFIRDGGCKELIQQLSKTAN